jgi:hypothetical protein
VSEDLHSKFVQNGQWMGLMLKIGPIKHKMPLGFISFFNVYAKGLELVPDFVITSNGSV